MIIFMAIYEYSLFLLIRGNSPEGNSLHQQLQSGCRKRVKYLDYRWESQNLEAWTVGQTEQIAFSFLNLLFD